MRRLWFVLLTLILAAVIHVDWHVARPAHHRLSLGWSQHWIFAASAFAIVGWLVARLWPEQTWRVGAWLAALAIVIAQGLEPMLEVAGYQHRFGFPDEPERWVVFAICQAAGLPAYAATLWLCRPRLQRGAALPSTA